MISPCVRVHYAPVLDPSAFCVCIGGSQPCPHANGQATLQGDDGVGNGGGQMIVMINGHRIEVSDPSRIYYRPRSLVSRYSDLFMGAALIIAGCGVVATICGVVLANPWVWGAAALATLAALVAAVLLGWAQ